MHWCHHLNFDWLQANTCRSSKFTACTAFVTSWHLQTTVFIHVEVTSCQQTVVFVLATSGSPHCSHRNCNVCPSVIFPCIILYILINHNKKNILQLSLFAFINPWKLWFPSLSLWVPTCIFMYAEVASLCCQKFYTCEKQVCFAEAFSRMLFVLQKLVLKWDWVHSKV